VVATIEHSDNENVLKEGLLIFAGMQESGMMLS